jgi:septum site-determining protein MinC
MEKTEAFPIKGFREGLLITVGDGDWPKTLTALLEQIDNKCEFFEGAKIALDVGERKLRAVEVCELRDELADRSVTLFALLSQSASTEAVAETLGISTKKSVLKVNDEDLPRALYDGETALFIRKTLRSGTSVKYNGSVIVEGDINPGAEVIASGSVIVWGKIRGSVHAGIDGSEKEIIAALEISTEKLRIATISYRENKLKIKPKKKVCKIVIEGTALHFVDWDQHKLIE